MPLPAIVLAVSVVVIVACTVVAVLAAVGIIRHDTKDRLRAEYSDFASQVIVNDQLQPEDHRQRAQDAGAADQWPRQDADLRFDRAGYKSGQVRNVETKTTVLSSAVTNATADEVR